MNVFQLMGVGFGTVLTPIGIALMFVGVFVGIIFGALPGLSATMAIALFLPVTYTMEPTNAMTLLMALFVLLYQGSQRQNLGIMRALGASPRTAQRYLCGSGAAVAVLGISIGTALSAAVMNRVQSWLLADAIAVMPSRYSIGALSDEAVRVMVRESQLPVWLLLLLALAQMALFGLVLLLHARQMARRSPRSLLSK